MMPIYTEVSLTACKLYELLRRRETSVYLYLAVVVNPRNAEDDLSLRLNDSVENACVDEVLSLFSNRLKGLENLSYRLNELRLAGISFLNGLKKICKIFVS